jgi:DNA-binding GntR family transcriptional regulator
MPRKKITVALSDQFLQMIDLALDTGGKIDLKTLSAQAGVSAPVMRRALIEVYGDNITFKKKVGIIRTVRSEVTA